MPHTDRCSIEWIGTRSDSVAVCPRIRIGRWRGSKELTCFGCPGWSRGRTMRTTLAYEATSSNWSDGGAHVDWSNREVIR
jgi:hypothetical protein